MDKKKTAKKRLRVFQSSQISYLAAVILLFLLCGSVAAFEIQTGNEDIRLNWDNTFRYNLGYRVTDPSDEILKNVNMDDADRNFDKGIVSNRLDILSELDLVYKSRYGFRISAAGWYDNAYEDSNLDNNSVATSNHMSGGVPALGLNDYTKFYSRGPQGEILDALVFGKVNVGSIPVNLRFGRSAIVWGETLLGGIHNIGYAQVPLDSQKSYSVPGAEVKELYRPIFNAFAQAMLTSNFSIAAQWMLEWQPTRFAEAGSYYSTTDIAFSGGETLISGPIRFRHGADVQPDGRGDYGVMARWTPKCFDTNGTIGIYYRRFSDNIPQTILDVARLQYYFAYGDAIDLYGVSFNRQIAEASIGAELSYRVNMPLVSDTGITFGVRPREGQLFGARGKTWHGLVNAIIAWKPPVYTKIDNTSTAAEITWSHVDSVTQAFTSFKGRPSYTGLDRVTEHAVQAAVNFTPQWVQVFPGWDLSIPLTYKVGLYGNAAVTGGGNEHAGLYAFGLTMDGFYKYNISLKYSNYFGEHTTGPTGAFTLGSGTEASLFDRGTIQLTFKMTL